MAVPAVPTNGLVAELAFIGGGIQFWVVLVDATAISRAIDDGATSAPLWSITVVAATAILVNFSADAHCARRHSGIAHQLKVTRRNALAHPLRELFVDFLSHTSSLIVQREVECTMQTLRAITTLELRAGSPFPSPVPRESVVSEETIREDTTYDLHLVGGADVSRADRRDCGRLRRCTYGTWGRSSRGGRISVLWSTLSAVGDRPRDEPRPAHLSP